MISSRSSLAMLKHVVRSNNRVQQHALSVVVFRSSAIRPRSPLLLSPLFLRDNKTEILLSRCFASRTTSFHQPSEEEGEDISRTKRRPTTSTTMMYARNMATVASSSSSSMHGDDSPLSSSSSTSSTTSPLQNNPMPVFDDAQVAYESKTTMELVRASLVFSLCRLQPLVQHGEQLLNILRRLLGDRLTDSILQQTMFGHFCAGTDETSILPTIQKLERAGIGSILDFAAEDDGSNSNSNSESSSNNSANKQEAEKKTTTTTTTPPQQSSLFTAGTAAAADLLGEPPVNSMPEVARMYDYESEAQCDAHVTTFKRCIHDVQNLGADGFAAIKVTALGNPKLLERMSRAIVETQNLFAKFDVDGNGIITRDEFDRGYKAFFKEDRGENASRLLDALEEMSAVTKSTDVDYITWSMMLTPSDLPQITRQCRNPVGPLALATPTEEEVDLMERMFARGHELAAEATACGTRLLIDAEQVRFQPAIDNLVLELQRKHNRVADNNSFPTIYNTYQCYLKDAPNRLATDVQRSERFQYHFGAKLVRGAYMESERELALKQGYPSPIHDTVQDTHDCYNNAVDFLLQHAAAAAAAAAHRGGSDSNSHFLKTEVMLATHNQESIEKAICSLNQHGIDGTMTSNNNNNNMVCSFGQLLGMADHLSYNLGKHGYRAYKYVPYGEIKMVMPYLIRRAHENSSIAVGGAAQELQMIQSELKRRLSLLPFLA